VFDAINTLLERTFGTGGAVLVVLIGLAITAVLVFRSSPQREALATPLPDAHGEATDSDHADVFISYARQDRAIAQKLSRMLTEAGLSVWWDFELVGGQHFREEIERRLEAARCVLVVWSPHSVRSDWVLDEANDALRRGIMVPLSVAGCEPPMGFRNYQTIPLTNVWREREVILGAINSK
jgi:hypothetical protein